MNEDDIVKRYMVSSTNHLLTYKDDSDENLGLVTDQDLLAAY